MKNSIYKRLIKLVFNYWPYLVLSTATAFVYVALNGISVWLTASLINNILSDWIIKLDDMEDIEVLEIDLEKIPSLIEKAEIDHSLVISAFYFFEKFKR